MLVAADSFDLAPAIDEVLSMIGDDARFSKELRAAQIEIVTPVCSTAAEACRELGRARRDLVSALSGRYRPVCSAAARPRSLLAMARSPAPSGTGRSLTNTSGRRSAAGSAACTCMSPS